MSPNGLRNPITGESPFAVVQLRQENLAATSYNMVGFQTKMAYVDQKEVFRMIPGLEDAEFLKLGSMHKNLFIHSPKRLSPVLASKRDPLLYFAGQISGVEGYFDSTCIGLLVARFLDQQLRAGTADAGAGVTADASLSLDEARQFRKFNLPPRETAFGSLLNAITEYKENFQPTNISFGLFPRPDMSHLKKHERRDRELKRRLQLDIAKQKFSDWIG